jgi:3-oxoacyl-[acyl-carrier protein] reductase
LRPHITGPRSDAVHREFGEGEVYIMATLQGKTALVTRASRGIGRAVASALADAGAQVLVHYGRSAQDAESLVAAIRSKGGHADAIRADLGTPEGATLLAKPGAAR